MDADLGFPVVFDRLLLFEVIDAQWNCGVSQRAEYEGDTRADKQRAIVSFSWVARKHFAR
jgi:hypothetical protein